MRFYLRKRRQPPAVIIVALIDVLIVVLIFLMVSTSFKKPQTSVRLVLPESRQATKPGANEAPPVVVIIEANGTLRYGPDARPITLEALRTTLLAEAAKNPHLKLALSADQYSPFGMAFKLLDIAKEAKITNPTAFARQPGPGTK